MQADIHSKISKSGSNLSNRLEDNLTGNFFGNLRYLSFNNGVKQILLKTIADTNITSTIERINCEMWHEYIQFWPYDKEGEIDVLIDLPDLVLGVEVKLFSGLSSDDEITNEEITDDFTEKNIDLSENQLARESRILSNNHKNKEKILIFIATEPEILLVTKDVLQRKIIDPAVKFVAISWQEILVAMKKMKMDDVYEQLIIEDLVKLLSSKGFSRFHSFETIENIPINPGELYYFDDPFNFNNIELITTIKGDAFYEFR